MQKPDDDDNEQRQQPAATRRNDDDDEPIWESFSRSTPAVSTRKRPHQQGLRPPANGQKTIYIEGEKKGQAREFNENYGWRKKKRI